MSEEAIAEAAPEVVPENEEAVIEGAVENVGNEIDEAIEDAKEQGDKKAVKELLQLKREIELKVNGKVIKKSFNSEDDLIKELQIAEMNKNGQQNYKAAQKEFQKLLENLSKPETFWETVKALNPSSDDFYKQRIINDYEEMERKSQMSEDQIERERLTKELESKEKRIKEWEDRQAKEKEEAEIQNALEEFTVKMEEALTKTKLPRTEKVFQRIANIIESAEDKGYKDFPVDAAVKIAEKEYFEEIKAILSKLDPNERTKLMGPAAVKEEKKIKQDALKSKPSKVEPKAPAKLSESKKRDKVHGVKNIRFEDYMDDM